MPVVTPDSVGPLRPDQTLQDVAAECPGALAVWDWGDEGIPEPALLLRLGSAMVQLTLEDTLSDSRVLHITTESGEARTVAGIAPGSTVAELEAAYGSVELTIAECALYATLPNTPGLSFRLEPGSELGCEALVGMSRPGAADLLPSSATVKSVIVYRR